METTIGLFGTCGGSNWRDTFMAKYKSLGIPFFNPQVDDWKPELADIEAQHLANDDIILFPVTGETLGVGSLAETGFSVLSAVRWNTNRYVVVYIEPTVSPALMGVDPSGAKDSIRARKLVMAHLAKQLPSNVYVVDSLTTMLETSLALYASCVISKAARTTKPWRQAFSSKFWLEVIGEKPSCEEPAL